MLLGLAVCLAAAVIIGSITAARHQHTRGSSSSSSGSSSSSSLNSSTSGSEGSGTFSSVVSNDDSALVGDDGAGGGGERTGDGGGSDNDKNDAASSSAQSVPFSPYANATHPLQPQLDKWGSMGRAPYPTGAWFTNALLEDGEQPVAALPYAVRVGADGLAVSYSADRRDTSSSDRVADGFLPDLTFSSTAASSLASFAPHLHSFDLLSATFQYASNASSEGGPTITVPLVKGCPYVTAEYTHAQATSSSDDDDKAAAAWSSWPRVTSASTITRVTSLTLQDEADGVVEGSPLCEDNPGCASLGLAGECCPTPSGVSLGCCSQGGSDGDDGDAGNLVLLNDASSSVFVELSNGQRWAVFASESGVGVRWTSEGITFGWASSISSSEPPPPRLVVRAAVVPSEGAEPVLVAHRNVYPTAGQVAWTVASTSSSSSSSSSPPLLSEQGLATLSFQWTTSSLSGEEEEGGGGEEQGDDKLAMMPLPHHLDGLAAHQGLAKSGDVPVLTSLTAAQAAAAPPAAVEAATARFTCMKGASLGLVAGATWEMDFLLELLTWDATSALDDTLATSAGSGAGGSADAIRVQVAADLAATPSPLAESSYTFGKQVGRLARLALVATQVGAADTSAAALVRLKQELEPWFTGTNRNALVFDKTWGGLVTTDGLADQQADFGLGWYNDHHFHFGYLVYASAVVSHFDPKYFSLGSDDDDNAVAEGDAGEEAAKRITRRSAVLAMAHDVCNPPKSGIPTTTTTTTTSSGNSSDPWWWSSPHFPVTRMKDWFDGHSWASGLFTMANGKSQESVSEAANAYYACALLGEALATTDAASSSSSSSSSPSPPRLIEGDDPGALTATGRLLLALEVAAAKRYWQVPLHEGDEVYPDLFVSANRMVGIVGGTDAVAKTWFGTEIEFVHCINMLPFTPATTHLLSPDFVREEFSSVQGRTDAALEPWRGFIFQDQAVIDPLGAWENLVALYGTAIDGTATGAEVDEGTSLAAMLYWTATRHIER